MPLGFTSRKFGLAKSIWNSFDILDRLNLIKCTNMRVSTFEEGESIAGKASRDVKGWVQLTNDQKRRIINCLDDLGMLN